MEQELISVVIPAYNAEKTILSALRSALAQTWQALEILVVDDASSDATAQLVEELSKAEPRIRLIRNRENRGVSYCRNLGVKSAGGAWVAFLDSDDLWRRRKLEKEMALAARFQETGLFFTGSGFIDPEGRLYSYVLRVPEKVTYRQLLRQNVISCSSVLARRELLERCPMENDAVHEDFAVWLRLLRELPYACGVDEPLLMYRVSSSSKSGNKLRAAKMTWETYRFVGEGVPSSLWNGLHYIYRGVKKFRSIARSLTDTVWEEEE